mmetsp:Transcript_49423/g.89478  ORF Transcript_49423/g.89478 Transcript_49423/m.89478 type:complete len:595 (+) Transcript_49423:79-1863(+)
MMRFTNMLRLVFAMGTMSIFFQRASSEVGCYMTGTVSYSCTALGSPIPIGAFESPRGSAAVFKLAWESFENVQAQASVFENSPGHISKYTMFWNKCENIPQATADITNPKNCTPHCAVEIFAPMGDQASMVAVQHVNIGWAFWNHFYVTMWCASANDLFDVSSFCNDNCVSHHPSRKYYFKHGAPKSGPHSINESIALIYGLSSTSKDVITTLHQNSAREDNIEVHVIQMNSMDALEDGEIADIIGELSLLDKLMSIYIAAVTGQVEPLLISLSKNSIRPENMLAMNTRIHSEFGIPENHLHSFFFLSDGETKRWQQCILVPAYNSKIMDTSRDWVWTITTSSRDALWSSSHPDLMDGFRRDVTNQALASILLSLSDNPARTRLGYVDGFGLGRTEIIAEARIDDSNNYFPFDPRSMAQGIAWIYVPLMVTVQYSSNLQHKWRMYETRAGCDSQSLYGKIHRYGNMYRYKKNPFFTLLTAERRCADRGNPYVPRPEYIAAKRCMSIIGVPQNNIATGESTSGMWMQQGKNIVSPNWPFVFNAFPMREMSQCGGLINTTAQGQATTPMLKSFGWRQKIMFMVLMAGAFPGSHNFP